MQAINTLDELDAMLGECDRAATDDDLRRVFSRFMMSPQAALPAEVRADPLGDAYHSAQMSLYERISGRTYSLLNEHTPFDVAAAVTRPFPYSTGSCSTAGDHLVTIGQFLKVLSLAPESRILELGPGWGNTTLALAALGHRVTAVDVEPSFCELIRRRAAQSGLEIEVVDADFRWVNTVEQPYDAIIFFECFHHAADHLTLLRSLHHALRPGGRVYLGAEPILTDFPIPWGIRLDGQSLWSVRKFGWMELGFSKAYFEQAFAATGWIGTQHALPGPATWELRRSAEPLEFMANDPRLASLTGTRTPTSIRLAHAPQGFAVFGPYIPLSPGRFVAGLWLDGNADAAGQATMDICVKSGTKILSSRSVAMAELEPGVPCLELAFTLDAFYEDVEVRLANEEGFTGCFTKLTITPAA